MPEELITLYKQKWRFIQWTNNCFTEISTDRGCGNFVSLLSWKDIALLCVDFEELLLQTYRKVFLRTKQKLQTDGKHTAKVLTEGKSEKNTRDLCKSGCAGKRMLTKLKYSDSSIKDLVHLYKQFVRGKFQSSSGVGRPIAPLPPAPEGVCQVPHGSNS